MISKSKLIAVTGWIGGLVVSYVACFGILALPLYTFSLPSRLGLVCALVCSVGANVFYCARILSSIAKQRGWTAQNCRMAGLLVIIPGTLLFLAGGRFASTCNVLLQEALWTGFLCAKFVYPNFATFGPYELNPPLTIFPK